MLFENFLHLFLESAPWLLLGLILAGLLSVFVPMSWMHQQLGGHGLKATIKAALLGAPLPLCSCGVIPAAVGLRRAGASKAATTSFLVSTPETGVDSVSVSYVLLGPFMAIVRPLAAVISAIVAGMLVGRDDESPLPSAPTASNAAKPVPTFTKVETTNRQLLTAPSVPASSCCSPAANAVAPQVASCCHSQSAPQSAKIKPAQVAQGQAGGCCSSASDTVTPPLSVFDKVMKGLTYAATDLVRDTTLWLLVGLFFAALVQTYVPADFLMKWGDGVLAMLVMMLVSVPMYICATASTPIAAGLLLAGISPGAVLVFMLAGPATNIATLGVVVKELGKRALYAYLGGVLGVALVSGILVNYVVERFGIEVMPQIGEQHQLLPEWLVAASGLLLGGLMLRVLWQKLPFTNNHKDCCS
ncbi:SO_0444 family Cu/Zn efflux transporter [Shewanella sp. NIFS-20-20]|uniref:SO_0444 family Cu/Zn efflux transporter n=1 Tax=Shewanella sp. NIFS-20-20 TaxID=2853806 RepID=UPI001C484BDD|nr:SO_0444 family Cu/Zn efflux transporter [Shewanella sp. NIFS-20-20]MBV7316951.1 SO_0444 family Cu/Zn efflux transporter [Shewanella sp. NIFS-20-20]